MRATHASRAALVALSSALAADCERPTTESAHTISTPTPTPTPAPTPTTGSDSGERPTSALSVFADGSQDAGPAQTVIVPVDAATYDALSTASDALPTPRTSDAFGNLGLTGFGAAYGSPPFGPDTRNIGRGPSGEATLTGLQPNEPRLRTFLRARHSQIVACYQRELTNNPTAFGAIEVQFGVRSNATLSDVTVRAPALAPSLAACVRTRFAVMRAPPAFEELGRITARYTFSVRR